MKPITGELSMQVYGDSKLQEQMLKALADTFKTEVVVRSEKPYETKYGRTGHYMNVLIKLPTE
jgi:hypothetical protein